MIKNRKSYAYFTLSFLFLLCFNIFTIENLLISNNLLFNNEQIKNLRASGEIWFPPEHLSIGSCSYPEITIDNYGHIHLIWRRGNNIFYKFKNVTSGNWTENEKLSTGISSISTRPDIAIDCFGNIHTTWQNYTSSNNNQAVFYRFKNISTGIWTPWEVLAIGSDTGSPAITTDHFGNLYLSFCYLDKIYMRRKSFNSTNWGSFESINSGATFGSHNPSIVVDISLNIYITWHDAFFSPSKGISQIYYARWLSSSSSWSSPIKVSTGSFDGSWNPDITIDASGTLHFVWADQTDLFNEDDDLSKDIFYRCRYSNGQWSSIKSLSDQLYYRSDYSGQKITIDNDNNIHVVWNCYYRKFDINTNVWKDTVSFASNGRDPALVNGYDNQLYLTWVQVIDYSADLFYRMCIIDDAKPIINVNSPTLNELYGTSAPSFNVMIYDANLDTMWYTLNNGLTNIIFADNGTIEQSAWEALPNGTVTVRFYANDSAGNIEFAEVTIRKDVNAPIVTINNPQNSDVIGAVAPFFNIAIDELNLDKTWYSLNGGNNVTFTGLTGTINQALWAALPEGNVVIRFYANDSVGNIGISEVTIRKDINAPIITINSPQNNDVIGATAPSFDITIDEPNLDKVWYSLNGGTNLTFVELTGTINQALWAALPEGNVVIKFYANDSAGNIGISEVTIRKDINAPIITINSPQNNDVIGATAPSFDITIDEPNLDKVWYSLNGCINLTFVGLTGTIDQALWDALSEGNVIIRFYANDTLGRIGFAEVTIKKDVTAPVITIINPQNNDLIGATAPNFNITIEEPNLDKVWYSLNGGMNITFTGLTRTVNQALWDALPEGNVTIRFYASDSAGNIGFQEVTVVKEISQTSPPGIPGFDMLFLVGIISAVTVIIIKKRLNHLD